MNIKTEKLKTAVKRLLDREMRDLKKPSKEEIKIKKKEVK